jgi:hypothetical protein
MCWHDKLISHLMHHAGSFPHVFPSQTEFVPVLKKSILMGIIAGGAVTQAAI